MPLDILLTADNHINYYSQKLGSRLQERRARIGAAWRETVDYALDNKMDLYLNAGDLFDQISPRNPPRARVVEGFRELKEADIPVFIIAGNHEAPASMREGGSPHCVLSEAGLANVFEDTWNFSQKTLEIDGKDVSIAGISYNKRYPPGEDPLLDSNIPGRGDINIAMIHYSIEQIAPPFWEEPMIKLSSIEANQHIDLFAMGHIHKQIQHKVGESVIIYPGATEHYNFGEADNDTGFCHISIDDDIDVEFIETESQPINRIKIHTSELSEKPTQDLYELLKKRQHEDQLLQVILEGDLPFEEYVKIDFAYLHDYGVRSNFYFEFDDRIRPIVEGMEFVETESLNPRKELQETAKKSIQKVNDEERDVWKRARDIALGYYDRFKEVG